MQSEPAERGREKWMENKIYHIKQNKMVRLCAMPAVNLIRYSRKIFYRFSADAAKVRTYKNRYSGERCFIIGNGPSLAAGDLDRLKGEHCFAANGIYRMFEKTKWRPEFYLCVDSSVLRDSIDRICSLEIPNIFIQMEGKKYKLTKRNPNITYINNYYPYFVNQYKRVRGIRVSEDVSHYFIAGETVTFNSIQFAIYMGFHEIYLLGVDHRYARYRDASGEIKTNRQVKDYFDDEPSKEYCVQNLEASTQAYVSARKYCDSHGIVIKNATRGGALEVFERVAFDDIVT